MDDLKRTYREVKDEAKKHLRDIDGHDVGDDIGNVGDEMRTDLGNAGDAARRAGREAREPDAGRDREYERTPAR